MTTDLSDERSFRELPEALLHVRWPEGRIRACNRVAEELTGYGREELVGSELGLLFADEERAESFLRRCRMALGRGQPARISYPVERSDGEVRPTEHVPTPLSGSSSDAESVLILMRNVTEEEARWCQLKQQLSYFQEAVQHIDEVFWLTPADKSEMLYVSPAYESLTGRTVKSLYEEPNTWIDAIHPDDREEVQSKFPQQREGEYDEEYRIVRQSGETRWVRDRAYPITDESGDVVRLVGVVTDITERKRAELERQKARDLTNAVLQGTTDAVFVKDREGRYVLVNEAAAAMVDLEEPEELEGETDEVVFAPETADRLRRDDRRIMATGETVRFEQTLTRADGRERVYETVKAPYRNAEGEVAGVVGVSRDVTQRSRAEEALERTRQKYETVFNVTPLALSIATLEEGKFLEINEGFEKLYGYEREAVVGATVDELGLWVDPRDRARIVLRLKETGAVSNAEVQLRTKSDEIIDALFSARRLTIGGEDCVVTAVHDITDRIAAERELERLALHDPLTGLHNRSVFEDRLEHALERARREETHVAVLFLDIDRFKVVNDSLGHSVGDEFLQKVASRLQDIVRESDTVARVGGDEFAVLLEAVEDREEAERAAQRVAELFRQPFTVDGTEIPSDVSIGLALSHDEEVEHAEDLLRFSDVAMYRMKEVEGTGYRVFDPSADRDKTIRFHRERRLEQALENDEFELQYQPVVALREGRIVGAEALVRWRHPEKGLRPPSDFISFAEESGLIEAIDQRVLERACRTAAEWRQNAVEPSFRMSVNLSARRYQDPELAADVRATLEEAGLPPNRLQLEITEGILMSGKGKLQELRADGVKIAIDDFGTGYSSLHYLKRLQADVLKLDQTFVADLGADARNSAIVEAVIVLARRMDLEVVAEGIETQAQLEHLEQLECSLGQGYYLGRPVPRGEFEELLAEGTLS